LLTLTVELVSESIIYEQFGSKARKLVNLDATQYQKADQAHRAARNAYIKVKGKLLQGKQPSALD